ncbi:MAG: hypothetical protein FWE24_11605 [Defluviitaleaceae bacterium]|nr:hypothetical protein [Defluviitaleaceae bacterium]
MSSSNNSIEHQLHRLLGGRDYATLATIGGIIILFIGLLLICIHFSKEKN